MNFPAATANSFARAAAAAISEMPRRRLGRRRVEHLSERSTPVKKSGQAATSKDVMRVKMRSALFSLNGYLCSAATDRRQAAVVVTALLLTRLLAWVVGELNQ